MKLSGPKVLLHLEGLVVFVAACVVYNSLGASWVTFLLLLFVPDFSMAGYVGGKAVGAWTYNAFHSYLGPALLWAVSNWGEQPALLPLGLIWAAHIGLDRLLGYGLKFPTSFKDTHLHRV